MPSELNKKMHEAMPNIISQCKEALQECDSEYIRIRSPLNEDILFVDYYYDNNSFSFGVSGAELLMCNMQLKDLFEYRIQEINKEYENQKAKIKADHEAVLQAEHDALIRKAAEAERLEKEKEASRKIASMGGTAGGAG